MIVREKLVRTLWAVLCLWMGFVSVPTPARAAWQPLFRGAQLFDAGWWFPTSTATGAPIDCAAGDLNGDGRPDLVVTNRQFGSAWDRLSILPNVADPDYRMFGAKDIAYTGAGVAHVVLADMDKDGKLDAVTRNSTTVSVLMGTGFGFFEPHVDYAVSSYLHNGSIPAMGLEVADMNGDTWPDVVIGGYTTSSRISVLLGTGGGALGTPVDYVLMPLFGVNRFVVGDATGDGIPDVVYTNLTGFQTLTVLRGNNDGTFAPGGDFQTGPSDGFGLAIGDFNEDSIPDIAVATIGISILFGTGGGAFSLPVEYPLPRGPRNIAVADVDADGHLDFVISSYDESPFRSVMVMRGLGSGSFAPALSYAAIPGREEANLVLADVDQSGRLDVVMPTTGRMNTPWGPTTHTVGVLLNDGAGGFLAATENRVGRRPTRQVIADVNRDGKADLVAADSAGVTIGLGDGTGFFSALPRDNLGSPDPTAIATGDWNRDGIPDFAAQVGLNIVGRYGSGNGSFVAGFTVTNHTVFRRSAADMNRDGSLDLVVTTDVGALRCLTQAFGTFVQNTSVTPTGVIQSLATLDWDRNGTLDAVVATTSGVFVYLGTGTGTFQSPPILLSPSRAYADLCAADFNRDGATDVAAVEALAAQGTVRGIDVFFNNGSGGVLGTTSLTMLEQHGWRIEAWDANADGKLDLIASATSDITEAGGNEAAYVEVFLGGGSGQFAQKTAHSLGFSPTSYAALFSSGDVTGDDLPDVVSAALSPSGSPTPEILLQTFPSIAPDQGNTLGPRTDVPTIPSSRIATGDLNRDGKLDVVIGGLGTPGVEARLGTGLGTWGANAAVPGTPPISQIGLGDLNRDGILDLVFSSNQPTSNVMSCMLGWGDGTFKPRQDLAVNPLVTEFEIGDMNRDGQLDLVVFQEGVDPGQYRIKTLLGNGNGTFTALAGSGPLGPVFDLELVDVNRDGILDVVMAGISVRLLYGFGDGSFGPTLTIIPNLGDVYFTSIQVADFNRDGFPDIAASDEGAIGSPGPRIVVGWGAAVSPFLSQVSSPLTSPAHDLKVGSAEADGRPFLYCMVIPNSVQVMEQGAPGSFTSVGSYATPLSAEQLALGDLNRDGLLDVMALDVGTFQLSVFLHGASLVTGVASVPVAGPVATLGQNYPNPFNPMTTIRYTLHAAEKIKLCVFDVHGRLVATLVDGEVPAGDHAVSWRGRTEHGSAIGSGIYFYRLTTASGYQASKRMVVVK